MKSNGRYSVRWREFATRQINMYISQREWVECLEIFWNPDAFIFLLCGSYVYHFTTTCTWRIRYSCCRAPTKFILFSSVQPYFLAIKFMIAFATVKVMNMHSITFINFISILLYSPIPPFHFYFLLWLGMTSHLTPLQLETLLTEGNTAKFWMVGVLLSLSTCNDILPWMYA